MKSGELILRIEAGVGASATQNTLSLGMLGLFGQKKPSDDGAVRPQDRRAAIDYLEQSGVAELLIMGDRDEIPADPIILAYLHRMIRKHQPKRVLEIGVGFSTLVMAHALYQNDLDAQGMARKRAEEEPEPGHLWALDAESRWIRNVDRKLPQALQPYVDLRFSDVEATLFDGELCHFYRGLPNITPDCVFIDGPHPESVLGGAYNLSFSEEDGRLRSPVGADMLVYESSLKEGFWLLVRGHWNTVHFLQRHLRRRYDYIHNYGANFAQFSLAEQTPES